MLALQRTNFLVLPVQIGRVLQGVIIEANKQLQQADRAVPSRESRRRQAPTVRELIAMEQLVRQARFRVYIFEKELNSAFVLMKRVVRVVLLVGGGRFGFL